MTNGKPRWSVECWNCGGEGYLENECDDDDCEFYTCDICEGKGSFIVTELAEDNCDRAIPVPENPLPDVKNDSEDEPEPNFPFSGSF